VLQDILVEIFIVVNLVDEIVHAWGWLRRGPLEALRTHDLSVVDHKLFVERSWRC
jgi:hypothetical protein